MQKKINRVAITGGTHGNELTGVYLIKKFQKNPESIKRESFETIAVSMNHQAIKACARYIDADLNRMFNSKDLNDPEKHSYEAQLAKTINKKLGPKGEEKTHVDFIVDLHTTTSNMGLSLVIDNSSALTWQVAAYLKEKEPKLNIFRWKGDTGEVSFVNSIVKNGFAIEVGAVPQGILKADLFFETEKLIGLILDYLELYNKGGPEKKYAHVEIYDYEALVDFPRDEKGDITAMIHPEFQGQEYVPLEKGDPLFITFEGESISYDKEHICYPLFINEAAYYKKGFALCLCEKRSISL